jgi:hypothetical protein
MPRLAALKPGPAMAGKGDQFRDLVRGIMHRFALLPWVMKTGPCP